MEITAKTMVIGDASQVAEVRRDVASLGRRIGLDEVKLGKAALITTELATNLLKHGGGGELITAAFTDNSGTGLELIALDKGAGITDIAACMRDGYSTAGSAGGGLGAINRLSDVFDLASWPAKGTAVLSRLYLGAAPNTVCAWGGVSLPVKGETECGDAWSAYQHEGMMSLLVADGLGHGPLAAAAARLATKAFASIYKLPLEEIASRLHEALRPSRGAAISVTRIDPSRSVVDHAGIGNIAGTVIYGTAARKMVSHNGTAGHNARKIQQFSYAYTGNPLVILHSDGLATNWALDRYPGLALRHTALISAVLYRDFSRGRDDVTVVAARPAP